MIQDLPSVYEVPSENSDDELVEVEGVREEFKD